MATLVVALGGCALPHSQVVSGSARPTLRLPGAPDGSELVLDGQPVGPAQQYDGVHGVMSIEEGPHSIEVRAGNATLVKQRIMAAAGEAVSVEVTSGVQQ